MLTFLVVAIVLFLLGSLYFVVEDDPIPMIVALGLVVVALGAVVIREINQ